MNIEHIKIDDIERVISIMSEHALQYPKQITSLYPSRWTAFLSKTQSMKCAFWIAREESQVLGHAGYIYDQLKSIPEIVGVVVSKQAQGRGIGRKLMEIISEELSSQGHKKTFFYTLGHPKNEDTLHFYRHIGFAEVNVEKNFFGKEYHRITFEKALY